MQSAWLSVAPALSTHLSWERLKSLQNDLIQALSQSGQVNTSEPSMDRI
jgi:hypothetical protein